MKRTKIFYRSGENIGLDSQQISSIRLSSSTTERIFSEIQRILKAKRIDNHLFSLI